MRRLRGQNAIEYMMTYGWAILVILVAGVAIWQMGFFRLSSNVSPDKTGFSQVTPIDWSLATSGEFTIVVQNNAGTILNLEEDGTRANLLDNGAGDCGIPTFSPTIAAEPNFRPADTRVVVFPTCVLETPEIGEYYRLNVTIKYTNPSSTLGHKSNGMIWGPVG